MLRFVKQVLDQSEIINLIQGQTITRNEVNQMISNYTFSKSEIQQLIANEGLSRDEILQLIRNNTLSRDEILSLITSNTLSKDQILDLIKSNQSSVDYNRIQTMIDDALVTFASKYNEFDVLVEEKSHYGWASSGTVFEKSINWNMSLYDYLIVFITKDYLSLVSSNYQNWNNQYFLHFIPLYRHTQLVPNTVHFSDLGYTTTTITMTETKMRVVMDILQNNPYLEDNHGLIIFGLKKKL